MKLIDYLSKELLLEKNFIVELSSTASQRYKQFRIPKRNGDSRTILHPARELKVIQRILHENILAKLPIHSAAFAYRKNISLLEHAKKHADASYILRMDFKNFFESISSTDIRNFIDSNSMYLSEKWCTEDTELLINLVCYKSSLTIGSVTSPILSNAICYKLDDELQKLCYAKGVNYTRYADDIYFSTCEANILVEIQKNVYKIVNNLTIPSKIKINSSKTHHASKKNKMSVTGLILTNDGNVSIGRDKKRKVRTLIFKFKTLDDKDKNYLSGYLSFCSSVEPEFINSLCKKYGAQNIYNIQNFMNKKN